MAGLRNAIGRSMGVPAQQPSIFSAFGLQAPSAANNYGQPQGKVGNAPTFGAGSGIMHTLPYTPGSSGTANNGNTPGFMHTLPYTTSPGTQHGTAIFMNNTPGTQQGTAMAYHPPVSPTPSGQIQSGSPIGIGSFERNQQLAQQNGGGAGGNASVQDGSGAPSYTQPYQTNQYTLGSGSVEGNRNGVLGVSSPPPGYVDPAGPPPASTPNQPAPTQPPVDPATIGAPGTQGTGPQDFAHLPYDPGYTDAMAGINAQRAAHDAGLAQQEGNYRLSAGSQERDIDQNAPDVLRNLLEGFANRGMAHSGRYAMDYGSTENGFASQKAGIEQNLAQQLAGLKTGSAEFNAGLMGQQATAEQNYIRNLAAQAGNLGLDPARMPALTAPVPVNANPGIGAVGSAVPGLANPVNVGTPAPPRQFGFPMPKPALPPKSTAPGRSTVAKPITSKPVVPKAPVKSPTPVTRGGTARAGNVKTPPLVKGVVRRAR